MTRFYGALVRPGSLVFDVGANRGDFAEVFLALGAKVVGVEPHPVCKRELMALFRRNPMFVLEPVAMGPSVCEMELYLGEGGMDNVSTLSDEYRQKAVGFPGLAAAKLTSHVTVQVETVDRLIARHGLPAFCKIDVEGFEFQVLSGLTQAIPLIQFEYQPWLMETALECVDRVASLGDYEFNLTASKGRDDHPELAKDWGSRASLVSMLTGKISPQSLTGDILARLR